VVSVDGIGEVEEVTERILAVLDTENRISTTASPEGSP
jgi:hypothetical protein